MLRCASETMEQEAAAGEGGATPQNSYGLSVSCIRVKNKILFERKGFSVNTQTS